MRKFQLRIEIADGFAWATVYDDADFAHGDYAEMFAMRLDRLTIAELTDLAALVAEGDGESLDDFWKTHGEVANG